MSQENSSVAEIFPATLAVVGADGPESILSCPSPESFKSAVSEQLNGQPAWLPFLAELELAVYEVSVWQRRNQFPADGTVEASGINPGLQIVEVPWSGLVALRDILLGGATGFDEPGHGSQLILVWPKRDGKVDIRTASDDDLLALKLASEKRDLFEVASETGAPVAGLTRLLSGRSGKI